MGWAEAEFEGIDLGDARRNRRVIQLVERLAERPTASLPGACQGCVETQGPISCVATTPSNPRPLWGSEADLRDQ